MIAKLKGLLDSVGTDWLIVDVNGVGYLVFASSRTLSNLPALNEPVQLRVETHVREDHIHLFGFADDDELDMFRLLLSVQGVGAKVALAIQGIMSPAEIQAAIAAGDKASVSRANGVGPKLAQRIVNELREKVAAISLSVAGGDGTSLPSASSMAGPFADAVSALVNLGYRPLDAQGAAARAQNQAGEGAGFQDIVRLALKELGQ